MLDARQLRMVRAIEESGSLSGAARALGFTQPAVSQQVRRLERRLGTALVDRSGRRVRLTEAGRVLARHAGTVLGSLAAAEEEVAALAGLRAGRVRLVAFPSSSASLVPRALARLRARHPEVAVSFTEAEPPESLAQLRQGRCDLAVAFTYPGTDLGRGEDDLDGLVAFPLLRDPLRVVLPAAHPLAAASRVRLADLRDQTWIAGCPRCRGNLLAACAAAGFEPAVSFATDDYVAVLGLVAAGLGVALAPAMVLDSVQQRGIVARPVVPASRRDVAAVTTPDVLRVPAVAAMLTALREEAPRPAGRSERTRRGRERPASGVPGPGRS
jgi:molybdate transport repressor ModE-like protein